MSENGRRRTRSQTARSRTQTPEAQAAGHEPQAPASIRSVASIRRTATKKPLLDTEMSNTYGSQGEKILAQQLSAQEAMNKAVNTIQNELAGAEAGPSKRLSTVTEEGAGDEQGSVVDRSEVSGKGKERVTIQLTQMKSFHREVLLQSEDNIPPRDDASEGSFPPRDDASGGSTPSRDDASDRHLPGVHDTSLLARLRARLVTYTPILEMLLFLLMAVIAFLLMAMWVGWRPLDGSLPAGEYNKSYVSGEFVKMTHVLQGESRQIGERLESQLRDRLGERLEGQARLLEERMEGHDRLLGERMEGHERRLQERLQSQDRHLAERIGELIQEQDKRLDERLDEGHREIGNIRDELESVIVKLREPHGEQVNYFSRGLAAVSTRFSSPTLSNPLTFKEKLASVRLELGKLPTWETEKPKFEDPMSIFNPWESFGQKWCSPSRRGKLQAVVRLAYKIAPTGILIEHMPKAQMPDVEVGTAPKEVELWIQVLDEAVRETVIHFVTLNYPTIMTKVASQRGKKLDPQLALDKTWVPVGQWTYDIHARGNVQAKNVPMNLFNMGVKTQAVALRVNSNWGSVDSTCLYRVRLYGIYQEPPTEFTDLEEISDEQAWQPWRRFFARRGNR